MLKTGKTLVLGLGNVILGDDGVGIYVARALMGRLRNGAVDIEEASAGGLVLLDLITNYERVIIVDAIITPESREPGRIHRLSLEDLRDEVQPYASHALDLTTSMRIGTSLGYDIPSEVQIYAVEIEENTIFREGLGPDVKRAADKLVEDLDLFLRS